MKMTHNFLITICLWIISIVIAILFTNSLTIDTNTILGMILYGLTLFISYVISCVVLIGGFISVLIYK
jgi:hypothetical protein